MACGCGKKANSVAVGTSGLVAAVPANNVNRVLDADGQVVAAYSNPVTARAEARRIGGTVETSAAPAAG